MSLKSKGKGNIAAQKQRRKDRYKNLPQRRKQSYELIDGNYSHYPVAECTYYGGYLTQGLIDTHQCRQKTCTRFVMLDE